MTLLLFYLLAAHILVLSRSELIQTLPGSPNVLFKQYSGYFKIGDTHFLHYWFGESQSNPSTDPLLLWLTGGPGCSGLSALFGEVGPFKVSPDGQTLYDNPYSFNKNANLLIFEAPVGVGYSYTTDANTKLNDENTAVENYKALLAFYQEFPQFKTNEFYLCGESYAGVYIPTLAEKILNGQKTNEVNLKGMLIGNGYVNADWESDFLIPFTYNHGLIDEKTWQNVKQNCCYGFIDDCQFHSFKGDDFCGRFVNKSITDAWYSGLNLYNLYADCESSTTTTRKQKRFEREFFMKTGQKPPASVSSILCVDESPTATYLNKANVRDALFIPTNLPPWDTCSDTIGNTYDQIYPDMLNRVQSAVQAGVRLLLYSGDVDMVCNFLIGQHFAKSLGFPLTTPKTIYEVNGQVGGFCTEYGSGMVQFATIRGAGHLVPTDKPEIAFYLFNKFLSGKDIASTTTNPTSTAAGISTTVPLTTSFAFLLYCNFQAMMSVAIPLIVMFCPSFW